ncbi:MAG: HlyD family type I secretion periplasmic adaptor subunit [Candidatus Roseilinea sp.]|jgi:HlyD family secretion protein|nr:MAG: HlyD family type I secretion periplasmic adaptor subunit [Candidatus Roseilinea sp.]
MRKPLCVQSLAAIAALLTLVGCAADTPFPVASGAAGQVPAAQPTAAATAVPTQAVAARTTISADGVVKTATPPIALAADVSAKVLTVNVEPGQAVKVGDVLAMLDDTALRDALADAELQRALVEAQIAQAQAPARPEDIASARAALAAAQANYALIQQGPTESEIEQARLSWVAAREAYLAAQVDRDVACGTPAGTGIPACQAKEASYGSAYESERAAYANYQKLLQPVTREQLTQANANVVSARARLQALEAGPSEAQRQVFEAQLTQARSAVQRARDNLREAIVRSPCTCIVQEVNVAVGGIPKGVAFTLVTLDALMFETTNLSERDLTAIKIGSRATIRLKAFDRAFSGKVAAILPQSTGAQGGAALFTVLIALDPSEARILPGMTGRAEIEA